MKFQAAIFDMDGTLINSLMFWDKFWERLGLEYLYKKGYKPDQKVDKAVRTMILSDAAIYFNKACGINVSNDEIVDYSTRELEHFYRTEASVKRGAIELLESLTDKGIKKCVASATDAKYVKIALRCLGLDKYFDTILSCSEIGYGKDRPDVYFAAQRALGYEVEQTVVFEDVPLALTTAKTAGFFTVGVYDKHNFNPELVKEMSDLYIADGDSLESAIKLF